MFKAFFIDIFSFSRIVNIFVNEVGFKVLYAGSLYLVSILVITVMRTKNLLITKEATGAGP